MYGVIAGVDIGGTNITTTLASRETILARTYQRTRLEGGLDTVPDQVLRSIDVCLEKTGIEKDRLIAVGIASAGPFRKVNGKIEIICHNICGGIEGEENQLPNDWRSIPIENMLENKIPNLRILNDAVSGAIAERTLGAGKGYDNMVYVTWSTGIGTGAFVDGHLIKGKNGNAPHGGHVYVGENGMICGCGNRSDMEGSASGIAIGKAMGTTAEEVFRMAREGNQKARVMIDDAARYFGRGLASINSVLDTELFIIGGSVFMNNIDLLLPMVKKEFYRSFPALSKDVSIVPSDLGTYLGDLASLSLVIPDEWLKDWMKSKPWTSFDHSKILYSDK